jgi:hypothetical protein
MQMAPRRQCGRLQRVRTSRHSPADTCPLSVGYTSERYSAAQPTDDLRLIVTISSRSDNIPSVIVTTQDRRRTQDPGAPLSAPGLSRLRVEQAIESTRLAQLFVVNAQGAEGR